MTWFAIQRLHPFAIAALLLVTGGAAAAPPTAAVSSDTRDAKPRPPSSKKHDMPSSSTSTKSPMTIVAQKPGLFGDVFVVDEGRTRALRFGSVTADDQTMIDLDHPDMNPVEYVQVAGAVLGFAKQHRTALVVGLGGGAFPRHLAQLSPGIDLEAVEIDPVVVEFSRKYFDLDSIPHLEIHVADGRAFVAQNSTPTWDVVLLDAYGSDDMPPALVSSEFFRAVRSRLQPGGAVVLNLAVAADTERKIIARLLPLYSTCVAVRTAKDRNLVVIATDHSIDLRQARGRDVARRQRARMPIMPLHFRPCTAPEPE